MALMDWLSLLLLAALAVLCQVTNSFHQTNTTSPTLGTAAQPGMRTVPLQETPKSQGKFGSSKQPAGFLEDDEGDNQKNILSQLLGDYDKVKAVSEGSDCQCKCVVKPLNREACHRIQKGTSQSEDSYTVETITSGPHCKCACIVPPSALNPCEGDFRLKKLRDMESSGFKLSTIIEILEGAAHGLDLLKLHAVTTKIVGSVEMLKQIVNKNITKKQQQLKGNVDEIWRELNKKDEQNCTNSHYGNMPDTRRILQRDAAAAYTNTEETFGKRFLRDDTFPEDPKAVSQMKTLPQLKKHTPLQQQILLRSKPASKPAIIRGITYYKAKFTEDESDIEEQRDDLFSGDGVIDLLIDDQLQKHEDLLAKTNKEHLLSRGPLTLNVMEEIDHATTQSAVTRSETDANNRAAFPTYSPSTTTESAAAPTSTVLDSFQSQTSATHTENSYLLAANNHIIMAPETFTISELKTIALTTTVTEKLATQTMTTQSPTTAGVKTMKSKAPPNMVRKAHSIKGLAVTKQGHDPSKDDEEDDVQKVIGHCKDTLSTISGPTTLNTYGRNEGAWMKDPLAKDDKIYVTNYYYGNTLVEFRNIENFKQGRWSNSYKLPYSWIGTGHVVYNGAFFYNQAFTRNIIKYNLKKRYVSSWSMLHDVVYEEATSWRWRGHSDIDFAVDENGLWIIYLAFDDEGFQQDLIVLSKLNPIDLTTKKETTWRTGLRKDFYGNCFIICGVLYAVDSYNKSNANISYAFDTHTNTQTIPRLAFENKYSYMTQIDYNPKDRLLYAWDNGHQVTYNVIFAY